MSENKDNEVQKAIDELKEQIANGVDLDATASVSLDATASVSLDATASVAPALDATASVALDKPPASSSGTVSSAPVQIRSASDIARWFRHQSEAMRRAEAYPILQRKPIQSPARQALADKLRAIGKRQRSR